MMPGRIQIPARPTALADAPQRRYWGSATPPKNRTDMFSTTVAAAADGASPSAATAKVATLRIYGPIDSWGGYWGISAKDVSAALDSLDDDVTEIRVRINSPGGEVWEGMAILNLLRAHKARAIAVVDGIAASAASVVATGCDETVMSPGTQMMIHDAWMIAWGDAADLRKTAEVLDSTSNAIASVYAESAGGSDEQWRAAMVEETWYTASEAVEAGLADRVAVVADAGETTTAGEQGDAAADDDPIEDHFDLSVFTYAGRANAPAPRLLAASASGSTTPTGSTRAASGDTTQEGAAMSDFTDEQLTQMRQRLGVAADADTATILAAFNEALDEQADPAPTATGGATAPAGMVLLDEAAHATLVADAAAGREARNEQLRARREGLVTAAINDGRIPPARREHWMSLLEADPGSEQTLAGLAKGLVPVDELGHVGQPDPKSVTDDELYAELFPEEA